MRVRCLIAVFLTFFLTTSVAQQTTPADAPASKEDILQLFEIMNLHQQMRLVMDSITKQQSALVRETMRKRYPGIPEERMARFESIMQESMRDFPVDAMLDDMVPVYQKHLTRTDVAAMNTFYSSPTGQKLLKEMPAMTSESMQAAYGRMQQQMEKSMDRIQKMVQEEQPEKKPSPKPYSQPKPQTQQD
jgi:uncharacterized protein